MTYFVSGESHLPLMNLNLFVRDESDFFIFVVIFRIQTSMDYHGI